ncbi:MAG: S8 family serine peptidase [Ilumatobacteraceae bacterium]
MKAHTATQQAKGRRLAIGIATLLLALGAGTTTTAFADKSDNHSSAGRQTVTQPLGSMYSVVDQIGARALWEEGYTGTGVNVALIDTGFAPVEDLLDSGAVVAAVDLSAEAGVPEATYVDNYGHGTHMAGIIAGHDPEAVPALAAEHPEWFVGVAPGAGIVSVKVADNTGGADITQVIAGVDWAIDHAEELDIRVINLSYASGSILPYRTDPLTFTLERAWKAGIVVVVAAGNDGRDSRSLSSPAIDPYVIAVGAVEATANGRFTVPTWASSGDGTRNPDIAAPGAHIVSLRAPLSRIDIEHPEGYVDDELFKGSGSSQAAAVVTGAVALLLDARPELTPDQVKAVLKDSTTNARPRNPIFSGNGVIQVDQAAETSVPRRSTQRWQQSDGRGSIEAARGPVHLVVNGEVIEGEYTVLGTRWTGTRWTGTRWTDGTWNGTRWTGGTWMGTRWTDATWTGTRWTGTRWTDSLWNGTRWTGTRWTGTRWTNDAWSNDSWTGTRWTGTRWTDDTWAGAYWDGTRWTGTRWTGTRWTDTVWNGTRWTGTRWTGTRWTDNIWSGGTWE